MTARKTPPKVTFKIGYLLRRLRRESGLSLAHVANRIGWPISTICRFERDQVSISLEVIERFAKGLGLRPEVVVLKCLRLKYRRLATARAGRHIRRAIDVLSQPRR